MIAAPCAYHDRLRDYVAGLLDLPAHEGMEAHLNTCACCQAELEALDQLPPPPLARLLARTPVPAIPPEPALRPLLERARGFLREAGPGSGDVLGQYRLLEPIGAGGMGRVFRAVHQRMERVVAVKVLAPELHGSPAARQRFQREVRAVARLSHPHIVAAYDAGEEDGRPYLVMELVEGEDLERVVRTRGPLPLGRALECLLQAARGLAHAHAAGLAHRDVKPSNLLLAADGRVKVLDLGLARVEAAGEVERATLTGGGPMGTAEYMAPEQAADPREAGPRADVYALGCTLFFLLAGRPPHQGPTALATLFAHRERDTPSLRTVCPDCPAAVDDLFRRMTTRDPGARPATMAEVVSALERLLRSVKTPGQRHDRLALLALGAACVAIPLLAFVMWLGSPSRLPVPEVPVGPKAEAPPAEAPPAAVVPGEPAPVRVVPAEALPPQAPPAGAPPATTPPAAVVPGEAAPVRVTPPAHTPTEAVPAAVVRPKVPPLVEMVLVQAGSFEMGSASTDTTAEGQERPLHRVTITRPFFLGRTEVTQRQYREVMGRNPSGFGPEGRYRDLVQGADTSTWPVESVTWGEAVLFCNRLSEREGLKPYYQIRGDGVSVLGGGGYRLPTEAEWEYACRAGTSTPWASGDDVKTLSALAWYATNSGGKPHPVGTRRPNAWGLYDMHGNVPEWCWDRYQASYYTVSPVSDPPGPGMGFQRVYRGGGWNHLPAQTRSAARDVLGIGYGVLTPVGLRVARDGP